MTEFSLIDHQMMATALRLAWRGRYGAHPNPRVGCVLAKNGEVVGRGWHERAGLPHAEINALDEAGTAANGATAYVTLEPCSHHGRTAPCADALLSAGVSRVVAAMRDPFPDVAGRGIARLREGGVDVAVGLLEAEARRLNEGYLSRIERGRPRVTVKIAASLDGATAMSSGESQWITSAAARGDVQRLRAESGAILTGVQTVVDDDPSLTVRDREVAEQPLRAVVDSTLRTRPDAKLITGNGGCLIYCIDPSRRGDLEAAGAEVVAVAGADGKVSLAPVLKDLAARGVNDLLVEAGPTLAGAMLLSGLADRVVIYQSPHIMGSETRPLAATPNLLKLQDRLLLQITDRRRIGSDTRITAHVVPPGDSTGTT